MTNAAQENSLTQDEIKDLARIMTIKYASQLRDRYFEITSKVDGVGAYVTTTLQNSEGSFVYPVEGRMVHAEQNISPKDALLLLIDYIDHYFEEYFHEDENVFLPIDWCSFSYEELDLQLRGQVINQKAQAQADALLAKSQQSE